MMAVNTRSWRRLPIADRDQSFNADESFIRCSQWAKGSAEQLNSLFLWRNPQGNPGDKNSYRLPIADIMQGRPHLIPHAVFTAAAFLSNKGQGAHGGLVGVVGDEERKQLQDVVAEIYASLSALYRDPRVKPPWLRGGEENVNASVTASVNSSGWASMPVAAESQQWDGAAAKARLWEHADGDMREYRKGFLWWDQSAPDLKGSYKLPLADVIDGTLTVVPRAVNAVAAVLGGARGGVDIPDRDMDAAEAAVKRIQNRFGGEDKTQDDTQEDEAMSAAANVPVAPPAEWFTNPNLGGPTPIAVTADGRVMGHLAAWNTCHAKFSDRCVTAPRSATGYKFFHTGSVLTADGSLVKVGKITLGTGHANIKWGWIPAADHYDNTGTQVAIVAAGEDRHGIWVSGSLVPEAGDETAAQLRRSPLSGDWRRINGNLELVAALAVNTPGFPIVNLSASGEPDSLCATGVIMDDGSVMAAADEADIVAPEPPGPDGVALKRLHDLQAYVDNLDRSRRHRRLSAIRGE